MFMGLEFKNPKNEENSGTGHRKRVVTDPVLYKPFGSKAMPYCNFGRPCSWVWNFKIQKMRKTAEQATGKES